MLDINLIRNQTERVGELLARRIPADSFDLQAVISLDDKRKELVQKSDELKAKRNLNSKEKPTQEVINEMRDLGEKIKMLDFEINKTEEALKETLSALPNIVADDVVAGGKENNKALKTYGNKPKFDFNTKDHVQLATDLGIIDYERGVKMSGNGFWVYKDKGAILEWSLLNYFINFHRQNGYIFMIPPFLLTEQSAYTSGHLPKFRDDLYWNQDQLCLNATSEMMLGNYHRDEIIPIGQLPLKYFAFSACFRREAGSYRAEERGMIRGHQFNKIEMFHFTQPHQSWDSFDELTQNASKLVEGLGLHFQTVLLAAGDASSAMAKTIDVEVWIPSMNIFKEVSSVSNALDYQSRRGNIRYKNPETAKTEFVHTLNASGLATSRLLPAILEQNQQPDGTVLIPQVLRPYCGFDVLN